MSNDYYPPTSINFFDRLGILGYVYASEVVIPALPTGDTFYLFNCENLSLDKKVINKPAEFNAGDGPITVNFNVLHDFSGGTLAVVYNIDADSFGATPECLLTSAPTGGNEGITISQLLVGNEGGLFTSGGGAKAASNFLTANSNTRFLVKITNDSGGITPFNYLFAWAEVPRGVLAQMIGA